MSFASYRHQWLCGFFKFLHLPDAGYKKTANRLQHVGQVSSLLRIVLRKLLHSKNKVKQVQNHINYLIKKRPALAPEQLPARSDAWDIDEEVSLKSGPRQAWDDQDTKQIIKAFKDFKTCPPKDQIGKMFSNSDDLLRIWEKEGFNRCYEKVKSIMKKKKNKKS